MFKDITLGQYYQADSLLHRLDPRIKLVGVFAFIVSLFIVNNYIGYMIAAVFLLVCILLSKVPVKFMVRGMKGIMLFLIIAACFNLFMIKGEVVFTFWKISIAKEGIIMASKMIIRMVFLIMGSSIMTLTTTPNSLTDALESLLKPLKIIKVPVSEIAMMMSFALRFIPILMEETEKIMKAQMARGVDFETGGLIKKAKNMIPLLVPLFVSAFRRANDLAMAMEARCYMGGDTRTRMKPLKYKRRDIVSYLVLLIYVVICVLSRRIVA